MSTTQTTAGSVPVALKPWRVAILAGMASYLDAGTLIAAGTAASIWQKEFQLSDFGIGFLAATLSVCVGLGAIFGGRIGDRFGRKRVYSIDLLVYAFGLLWLIFVAGAPMLFIGAVIVGLAIGADVPASLALVGEMSPANKRGRLVTFTQVMWTLGPLTMTIITLVFSGWTGTLLPRIIFAILLVVSVITWGLRRKIKESAVWEKTKIQGPVDELKRSDLSTLLHKPLLRGLLFTGIFYLAITLASGMFGSFGLYAIVTVAHVSTQTALLVALATSPLGLIALLVVMRAMDRGGRRTLFWIGSILQVLAWGSLLFVPPNAVTLLAILIAFIPYLIGGTIAGEAHYKVWSQEIFPTRVRGTATGITFGVARALGAVFLIFVPTLLHTNFTLLVVILLGLAVIGGVVGIVFMPRKEGESIEQIDAELTTAN